MKIARIKLFVVVHIVQLAKENACNCRPLSSTDAETCCTSCQINCLLWNFCWKVWSCCFAVSSLLQLLQRILEEFFFFHFDVSCYKVVLLARPIFKLLSNQESQSDFSSCQNNIPRANSANQTFREEHSSEAFLWDQDQCWTEIHRKDTGNARSDAVGSIPFYWSVVEALGPRMYAKKKFAQPWIFGSVQWKGTILFSLTIPEPRFEHKFCDAINWEGNECFLLCFLRDINKVSHSKRISQHIFLSSLKTSLFVFVVLEAWMWQDSLQEFSYVLVRTRVNKYQPKKKTPHTPQFMSLNIKQHWRSHYHSSVDVDFLQSNVWR